ncbi:hypothetical protein EVAR_59272_1 [Eumeta japonica]|uniref:Uncharacterized protein n=1 Tax=Eumeta variegata TaxID=151549 RepID=A0A4C1YPN5_EUMVA|nr:hypothetical protein EVAR_59272_1 [Eumeta japonica]
MRAAHRGHSKTTRFIAFAHLHETANHDRDHAHIDGILLSARSGARTQPRAGPGGPGAEDDAGARNGGGDNGRGRRLDVRSETQGQ